MNAIPTTYRGIRFRSRLEAKWAAFFDAMEWPWEYEPIDLRGYVPDFILKFQAPVLVEVKPVIVPDGGDIDAAFYSHRHRIENSGWNGEAVIVGSHLFRSPTFPEYWSIGLHAERLHGWMWADAPLFRCDACQSWSFCNGEMSYRCRRSGCHDGDGHIGYSEPSEPIRMWSGAANETQWHPR